MTTLAFAAGAGAQTSTWTGAGGGDGDWFDEANWSGGVPNDASTTAVIGPPAPATIGSAVVLDRLQVGSGGAVVSTGDASFMLGGFSTNGGTLDAAGASLRFDGGPLRNNGLARVGPGGSLTFEPGALANANTTDLNIGGGTYVADGGRLDVLTEGPGDFDLVANLADLTFAGAVETNLFDDGQSFAGRLVSNRLTRNLGDLRLLNGTSLTTNLPASIVRFENSGDFQIGAGSRFSVLDDTLILGGFNTGAGRLLGEGTIDARVDNDGVISPGDVAGEAGTLTILGQLILQNSGTLELDLLDGGHDRIAGVTDLELRGDIDIHVGAGFTPADGQVFEIIDFSGELRFDNLMGVNDDRDDLEFKVVVDEAAGTFGLRVAVVPEPASLALLGVAGLALRRRR